MDPVVQYKIMYATATGDLTSHTFSPPKSKPHCIPTAKGANMNTRNHMIQEENTFYFKEEVLLASSNSLKSLPSFL